MYRVLVCDDEKDIVSALEIYLMSEGYEVVKTYNGREALEAVKLQEIHLVLMDIMMPVMDGIQAMAEIRKISNVPVILLTAKSEDTDKVLGLTSGRASGESQIPDKEIYASGRRYTCRRKAYSWRNRSG